MSKEEIKDRIWKLMERKEVARFPGTRGRIPNFSHRDTLCTRCSEGGEKALQIEVWREAKRIKANPDMLQRPVRELALAQGKVLYMAVPRLRREDPFLELDPSPLRGRFLEASTTRGAFRLGSPISPEEVIVTSPRFPKPEGICWEILEEERFKSIPILTRLRSSRRKTKG